MFIFITFTAIFLYLLYMYTTPKKPPNFPPGPTNYPLVGGAWILGKLASESDDPTLAITKLRERYGPITGIYLGLMRSIIVVGYETVKEVLTREEFQGRPDIFTNRMIHGEPKLGLIFAEGEKWKEQRRFTLRNLRNFGFGKSSLESVIHEEITECIELIKNKLRNNVEGVVPDMHELFGPAVINVLWLIMSGKRSKHDDPEFLHLLHLLNQVFRSGNAVSSSPIQDWPFLRFIPPFSTQFKELMVGQFAVMDMIKKEISAHETTRDASFNRDFIDLYLHEIDEAKEKADSNFSHKQLLALCSDLFMAGSETSSNSISFAMLYMMLYPEVQEKVQEELDRVIGRERLPSYEDKSKLPFVEATLCELMRVAGIAPSTVPHCTTKDTKLHGYDIPKDTFVMVSIASVHREKAYWGEDSEKFRPQRWIDAEGKVIKTDHLMGFGFGSRMCLGQTLALINTFDFFTAMLQTFKLEIAPGKERPSTIPVRGFTAAPQPFVAKISLR